MQHECTTILHNLKWLTREELLLVLEKVLVLLEVDIARPRA